MEQIILWEINIEIIRACELAIYKALKKLDLKATVIINSEPPLIGRNQLWGRLPVIEIRGLNWSLKPRCAFRVEDLNRLFSVIFSSPLNEFTGQDLRKTSVNRLR